MRIILSKEEFIAWLSEHSMAFEDFCNYFNLNIDDEDIVNNVDLGEIISWMAEHQTLGRDFIYNFSNLDLKKIQKMNDEELFENVNVIFGL